MASPIRTALISVLAPAAVAGIFSLGPDGPRHKGEDGLLPLSATRLPAAAPRYQMNKSTIIMPCNNSGYMDPDRTKAWCLLKTAT